MLTLFSSFKPFRGHFGLIQRNALESWARLEPAPEILVFDDSEGSAEAAAAVGARHVPEVRRSRSGAPLVSDLFARAAELASRDTLCFVNGDILLTGELTEAIRRIRFEHYLLVGRRTDLDLDRALDFTADWQTELRAMADRNGRLQGNVAIDYFVFPRGLASRLEIPDLALGRPRWDNWMLYRARELGVPLVDLTPVVRVFHQNHGYGHLEAGEAEYRAEGRENLSAAGGKRYLFNIGDATHRLTPIGLERNRETPLSRRLDTFAVLHPWSARPLRMARRVGAIPARLLHRSD